RLRISAAERHANRQCIKLVIHPNTRIVSTPPPTRPAQPPRTLAFWLIDQCHQTTAHVRQERAAHRWPTTSTHPREPPAPSQGRSSRPHPTRPAPPRVATPPAGLREPSAPPPAGTPPSSRAPPPSSSRSPARRARTARPAIRLRIRYRSRGDPRSGQVVMLAPAR